MSTRDDLMKLLQDRDTRHLFMAVELRREIARQVREHRLARGWSQGELAREAGLGEGVIARVENPDGDDPEILDLQQIAGALDVALSIRFISWGEFVDLVLSQQGIVVSPWSDE